MIGDHEGTWANTERLRDLGMDPVPVVTFGADRRHLERALQETCDEGKGGGVLGLGGLVPYATTPKKLIGWLDRCFIPIRDRYKQTGVMPKVHLLGVSQKRILERYPAYSSDSTSWLIPIRYGRSRNFDRRVPRATQGGSDVLTVALRREVEKAQQLEAHATALWAKRGVVFDE